MLSKRLTKHFANVIHLSIAPTRLAFNLTGAFVNALFDVNGLRARPVWRSR
jgi:hypothetical protein